MPSISFRIWTRVAVSISYNNNHYTTGTSCNTVYNQNTKRCIFSFPKKGDQGIAKNFRTIILTSIAAKIYNTLLQNHIEPIIEKILRKNQNGFSRNRSTTSQILTIRRILEGVRTKTNKQTNNLQATFSSLWLHTQWENGANASRLRLLQRNHWSHNDDI